MPTPSDCIPNDELRLFLEEQLGEEQTQQITQHVEHCKRCRQALNALSDDEILRGFLTTTNDEDFLASPISTLTGALIKDASLPCHFGRFELRRHLGGGGFGTVYLAFDTDLEREVAIKIPHLERLSPGSRLRFITEGRAAACLHHPNIVSVLEAGVFEQISYIVSDYIPGPTLHEHLQNEPSKLSPQVATRIILQLTTAVSHAHECKIIHCDIKPSNILLDTRFPDRGIGFRPLLTDFGIARFYDQTRTPSEERFLAGSLSYMAPELSCGGTPDPRSDIYAIGAVLCELLTGHPPSRHTTQKASDSRVTSPFAALANIPLDLVAICQKCLAARPEDRYLSAHQLEEDLDAFLHHAPTIARPLNPASRMVRWCRRNPVALAMLAAPLVLLMVVLSGLLLHNESLQQINQQLSDANLLVNLHRAQAEQSESRARLLLYAADMRLAELAWRKGDLRSAREILDRYQTIEQPLDDGRGLEWHFLLSSLFAEASLLADHPDWLHCLALHPTKPVFATAGSTSNIYRHDLVTGKLLETWQTDQLEINSLAFSDDGEFIASAGDDGSLKIWKDGKLVQKVQAHHGKAYGVALVPGGNLFASCGTDGYVKLWQLTSPNQVAAWHDHQDSVEAIAVSESGSLVASVGRDGKLVVRDLEKQQIVFSVETGGGLSQVAFSPNEKSIATVSTTNLHRMLTVYDWQSGDIQGQHQAPDGLTTVGYSPDGNILFVANRAGTLQYWQSEDGTPQSLLSALPSWERSIVDSRITAAVYSHSSDTILCTTKTGQVLATDLAARNPLSLIPSEDLRTTLQLGTQTLTFFDCAAAMQGDGIFLSVGPALGHWQSSDSNSFVTFANYPNRMWKKIDVTSNGDRLAAAGLSVPDDDRKEEDNTAVISLFDTANKQESMIWRSSTAIDIANLAISADGRFVAFVVQDVVNDELKKQVFVASTAKKQVIHAHPASSSSPVCFAPDGKWLFFGRQQELVALRLESDQVTVIENAHANAQHLIAVDRTGRWLATADAERVIKLWRLPQLELHAVLVGHVEHITDMKFSANGRTLVSSSIDGTIKAWNVPAGRFVLDLYNDPKLEFSLVELTPENEYLFYARSDSAIGTIRLMPYSNSASRSQ